MPDLITGIACCAGTFGPSEGGELCLMCPANYTTLADGSTGCDTPVGPDTDLWDLLKPIKKGNWRSGSVLLAYLPMP